jgi:hypothetical protein
MTREQYLNILILLSTLESLILAHKVAIPEGLFDDMERSTDELRKEILK